MNDKSKIIKHEFVSEFWIAFCEYAIWRFYDFVPLTCKTMPLSTYIVQITKYNQNN